MDGRKRTRDDVGSTRSTILTHDVGHWNRVVSETCGTVQVVPQDRHDFYGRFERRDFDVLRTVKFTTSAQRFERSAQMLERHPVDEFTVTVMVAGRGMVVQDGRSCLLDTGDFTVVENGRPYSMVLENSGAVLDLSWPREAIGLHRDESSGITALPITSGSSLGRWLGPALTEVASLGQELSPEGAARFAHGLAGLTVAATLELRGAEVAPARARQQFDRIMRYIECNLEDPELSVETIARDFYVSPRTVQRVFCALDRSVSACIRERRLEACRQMLISASYRARSISFIASQFGFTNSQAFSRAFRSRFNVTPTEYRHRHSV